MAVCYPLGYEREDDRTTPTDMEPKFEIIARPPGGAEGEWRLILVRALAKELERLGAAYWQTFIDEHTLRCGGREPKVESKGDVCTHCGVAPALPVVRLYGVPQLPVCRSCTDIFTATFYNSIFVVFGRIGMGGGRRVRLGIASGPHAKSSDLPKANWENGSESRRI